MSFLAARAAATRPPQDQPPRPGSSFLADRAAAHAARERARQTHRPDGGVAAVDPERCKRPGVSVNEGGNGRAWVEEDANWTDETAVLETHRERHTGRRLAVRLCPDCWETRPPEGPCWCGSTRDAVRRDGKTATTQRARTRFQTEAEREAGAARQRELRESRKRDRVPAWRTAR